MSALVLIAALMACGQSAQDKPDSPADRPHTSAYSRPSKVDPQLSERCGRSIRHITKLIMSGPGSFEISPNEASIIEVTTAMSIATCESEGLSPAQEACMLAVEEIEKLSAVAQCPAIVEHKPRWLVLPPTEAEREALLKAFAEPNEAEK